MAAPSVTGTRRALIVGHSLDPATQAAGLGLPARPRRLEVPAGPEGTRTTTIEVFELGDVLVLPRHGVDRFVPAHLVDHHANLRALCGAGADRVLALASCGSLRADLPVGSVLWPDDFLAPWCAPTFHSGGEGHIVPGLDLRWRADLMGDWGKASAAAVPGAGEPIDGGVYAQTTGPRFETPAEVRMLATFADVVGMTLVGEAVLARECGLRYAAACTVDNLANGLGPAPLTKDEYHAGVAESRRHVAAVLKELLARWGAAGSP